MLLVYFVLSQTSCLRAGRECGFTEGDKKTSALAPILLKPELVPDLQPCFISLVTR